MSTNGAGATGHPPEGENEPGDIQSHTFYKINSKGITNLNVKPENFQEKHKGENIQDWGLGREFRLATESLIQKEKKKKEIDKLDLNNI